jgi:peptidoglycan/LPS O-acetylase OafA/YrhL
MPLPSHTAFVATRRFGSLDGLRCLAILPVIWHHSTPRQLQGVLGKGPLGVHLFFALSGFLITTLLLRERDRMGRISLRAFWARRGLRIFPLYYAVLALFTLRTVFWLSPSPMRDQFLRSLPFYATYTGNWFVDYGVAHPIIFAFSWSLATEEQFYLFWPPLLRFTRGLTGPVLFASLIFFLDFSAERGALGFLLGEGTALTIVTSVSAPICLGSLLALGLHDSRGYRVFARVIGRRFSAPTALALLALLVLVDAPLITIHLAMVLLVGAVSVRPDHGLRRPLEWALVRHVGTVSYGMYLLHVSAITALKTLLPALATPALFVLASLVTLALASASYRWFEQPFLRMKDRLRAAAEPRAALA